MTRVLGFYYAGCMDLTTLAELVSLLVSLFVASKGFVSLNKTKGTMRNAIGFITAGVLIVAGVDLFGLLNVSFQNDLLRPLFWYMDIATSLFLFGAISALTKKK